MDVRIVPVQRRHNAFVFQGFNAHNGTGGAADMEEEFHETLFPLRSNNAATRPRRVTVVIIIKLYHTPTNSSSFSALHFPLFSLHSPLCILHNMKEVLELLRESGAMLEGHFLLSSGRHSDKYFQCARLFQYPDRAAAVLAPLAERIRADISGGVLTVDAVVGPAIGGIVAAYELGRQLGLPAFFTERDDSGKMSLRRGFELRPGEKILICEDVITTGKSSGESAAALEALGARVVAAACVVDRRAPATDAFAWPLYAACKAAAANWDAADCELCKQGIPAVKPGSRNVF
jgi:orotate phosphoribosyltransferase